MALQPVPSEYCRLSEVVFFSVKRRDHRNRAGLIKPATPLSCCSSGEVLPGIKAHSACPFWLQCQRIRGQGHHHNTLKRGCQNPTINNTWQDQFFKFMRIGIMLQNCHNLAFSFKKCHSFQKHGISKIWQYKKPCSTQKHQARATKKKRKN